MNSGLLTLTMLLTLGNGPYAPYPYVGGDQSYDGGQIAYPEVVPGAYGEPQFRYDQQDPWLHGYWQEIPAYRGHGYFRPYNYKHVLSQSQTAAGWGLNPQMAWSQQFWHQYHSQATLQELPPAEEVYTPPRPQAAPYQTMQLQPVPPTHVQPVFPR